MRFQEFVFWVVLLTPVLDCNADPTDAELNKNLGSIESEKISQNDLKRELPENDGPVKRSSNTFVWGCSKRNCKEWYDAGYTSNGVYCIDHDGQGGFLVYCDMVTDGGGWTVFHRRLDGTIGFYLEWNCYKYGFGNMFAEHWLGLEKLRRMTSQQSYKLRVDLMDADGNWRYAQYSYFAINTETLNYKLNLGNYSGTAGDSLSGHANAPFTTKDQDNDSYSGGNCATQYSGAWWYTSCHSSNLNALYIGPGTVTSYANGVVWSSWKGQYYSLKRAEMKIRPV